MGELRLYMFECGTIRLKLHDIKMNQGLNELYRVPVPWFLLKLPPMLLTADAAYTLDHWNEKALPGFLTSTIDAVRSGQKLHRVVRQSGAQVVTGHDPEAWPTFKKAPDFYN